MASPCLRAEEYEVFDFLEINKVRADPTNLGHKDPWEIFQYGPMRAFIICIILCLLGWFPGVIFSTYMAGWHVYQFFKECW